MHDQIRWGIVGPGKIAHKFVQDLQLVGDAVVAAVASRDIDRSRAFADRYGIDSAYGSYASIFDDPSIDIVYIATPHDSHAQLSVKALRCGKAVLCEKPAALNSAQAKSMVDASRAHNRFLMEAFWTRFNPSIQDLFSKIQAGDIGQVKYINADFSFRVEADTSSRMLNMNLGGGSLLDMGVYPVFLAYLILGVPEQINASSRFHATGADLQTAMIFDYADAQALLYSSFASRSTMQATVSGTEGMITIHPVWHEADSYSLYRNSDSVGQRIELPRTGKGFYHEILECHNCMRKGAIESNSWSHRNSLELIGIIDKVREIVGLEYPSE